MGRLLDLAREAGVEFQAGVLSHLAFSAAVTRAIELDGPRAKDRSTYRRELTAFLKATVQAQDAAIPVWLNAKALGEEGQCVLLAEAYGLDALDVARAWLIGLPESQLETLCHIAGVTHQDVYRLTLAAASVEANADKGRAALERIKAL